jgi:hypothetical protein
MRLHECDDTTPEEIAEHEAMLETNERCIRTGMRRNIGVGYEGFGTGPGRGSVGAREYRKEIPLWTMNQTAIAALVKQVFTKLDTDAKQRRRAAYWASVIHLYWRMRYTVPQIAHEMGSSVCKVRGVIRSAKNAAAGLRADGTAPRTNNRGKGPRRPRRLPRYRTRKAQ